MDAKERAEKIYKEGPSIKNWPREEYIDYIAAQIEEACAEAVRKFVLEAVENDSRLNEFRKQYRLEGYRAAQEQAKGIAEEYSSVGGRGIAKRISAMEPPK